MLALASRDTETAKDKIKSTKKLLYLSNKYRDIGLHELYHIAT